MSTLVLNGNGTQVKVTSKNVTTKAPKVFMVANGQVKVVTVKDSTQVKYAA